MFYFLNFLIIKYFIFNKFYRYKNSNKYTFTNFIIVGNWKAYKKITGIIFSNIIPLLQTHFNKNYYKIKGKLIIFFFFYKEKYLFQL